LLLIRFSLAHLEYMVWFEVSPRRWTCCGKDV
jgi:hypothetical protein